MLITDNAYLEAYRTPARELTGKITYELPDGTIKEILPAGDLISFSIEKATPSGKLFGFAASQKIKVVALGIHDDIQKGTKLVPSLGVIGEAQTAELPYFYVDTIDLNKVNKTTTITGYDAIGTNKTMIDDVAFTYPLTLLQYATQYVSALGLTLGAFEGYGAMTISQKPNFNGYETPQTVLAQIAEASGTICYISSGNNIKFRRLVPTVADNLNASHYFEFSTGAEVKLTQIASTTQLGDNVVSGEAGYAQAMWDNAFLDLREDLDVVLPNILLMVKDIVNKPYKLTWRGCPAYEIGDYIAVQERPKSDEEQVGITQYIYYMGDTITYNGGMNAASIWEATNAESIEGAPTTLGQKLNQTYAKVDKVNQTIELAVKKVDDYESRISKIEMDTDGITASFQQVSQKVDGYDGRLSQLELNADGITAKVESIESTTNAKLDEFENIINSVETSVTPEYVQFLISQSKETEVDSVTTSTGFTFNEIGLTVNKSSSEMSTTITEDGMRVYKNGEEMLTADNTGVKAVNLHATTWLHVGSYSRFADYKGRTGCFWVTEGVEEE